MNSLPPTPDSLKAGVLVGGDTQPRESGQHFICHGNSTREYTMCVSLLVFVVLFCFFACKYVCVSYVRVNVCGLACQGQTPILGATFLKRGSPTCFGTG